MVGCGDRYGGFGVSGDSSGGCKAVVVRVKVIVMVLVLLIFLHQEVALDPEEFLVGDMPHLISSQMPA